MAKKKQKQQITPEATPVPVTVLRRIDLGCGKNKIGPDWIGVDELAFPGVDVVANLTKPWPWADNTVDEAHSSHFIEHLDAMERVHFVNELYRVLKPGASAKIIAPHWSSQRAYGDVTHKWPPVCEFWFYYLDAKWREVNAPHNTFYKCNFKCFGAFNLRPDIAMRNVEYQQFASANFKDVNQDIIATFVKE